MTFLMVKLRFTKMLQTSKRLLYTFINLGKEKKRKTIQHELNGFIQGKKNTAL